MNKKEVLDLIQEIEACYPGRLKVDDGKALIIAWHRILKDYECTTIMDNLTNYIKFNRFPPTIADLINPKSEKERYVPSAEETRKYLEERQQLEENNKRDASIQEARKKAREEVNKILGRG